MNSSKHEHTDNDQRKSPTADNELDEATVVPIGSETEEERLRIRASNDRDQKLEREGRPSRHNQGYDEVADLKPTPGTVRAVDQ